MALPTWVAAGAPAAGIGDITPGIPASAQAGDELFLACATPSQTVAAPSGWTESVQSPQLSGAPGAAGARQITVFQKTHDGSETDSTITDPGDHVLAVIVAVRDYDNINASSGGTYGGNPTVGPISGATTTVDDCLALIFVATMEDNAVDGAFFSNWTNGGLTNLTERVDAATSLGNGSTLGIATGERATAGTLNATTVTQALQSNGAFITLCIEGAAAGGGDQTLDAGVAGTGATVPGADLAADGDAPLDAGTAGTGATVLGAELAASGEATIDAGVAGTGATVPGAEIVESGSAQSLDAGVAGTGATVPGAELTADGDASLNAGRAGAGVAVPGADVVASGNASLDAGAAGTGATVPGAEVAPSGNSTLDAGRAGTGATVPGAHLIEVQREILDVQEVDFPGGRVLVEFDDGQARLEFPTGTATQRFTSDVRLVEYASPTKVVDF